MKRNTALCECGHWSDQHQEFDEGIKCARCGCNEFRHDWEMERDLEQEARQLEYDIRRGK